jgi:beta-phosphoglucomutase family hydrolase
MKGMRGVLWDMDGVLVSTGEFHFQAWSETLAEYEVPFTREQFRATFGMNNARILDVLLEGSPAPELVAEISERKEVLFRRSVKGQARLLPGVREWLDRCAARGVKQAIASSAPPANIDVLVDELGIRAYFAAIVSGDELPGKPDPAVFLKAARSIGVAPERCVVVEDAMAGVEAAKRGGMKCIAVTTTNPAEVLKAADIIVRSLDELAPEKFERLWPEMGE